MAIQNRRGKFTKFDPSRMVPGEWAVVLDEDPSAKDGRSVYICFAAGSVKRMSTHEDMVENVAATIEGSITDIKKRLTEVVEATDAQIKAAEQGRVTAEQGRVTAEQGRVTAEQGRVTAEQGRVTAEQGRVTAEQGRVEAERARVGAEKQRELRQAKNDADQAQNNEAAKALTYHICQPNEYSLDAEGQHNIPTITGKNGVVYWTPVVNKDHEYNRYDEWAWVDGAWELKGESKHVAPVTTDDIDKIAAGQSVTGTRVVDTTGLTYLWAKLGAWAAAKFSAIGHKHPTSDVTGLDTALGDKATKEEVTALRDSLSRAEDALESKTFPAMTVEARSRAGTCTVRLRQDGGVITREGTQNVCARLKVAPAVEVTALFGVQGSAWGVAKVDRSGAVSIFHLFSSGDLTWGRLDVSLTFVIG